PDVERAEVLLQVRAPLRARDRDDVVALREDPRERELRGPAALLRGELLHAADEVEVLLEVVALEARRHPPVVVGREVLEALDLPGEEAASERAVRHEPDPELPARGEDAVFRIAAPERVLGLDGGDRVDGGCAPERLRTRLR